MVEDTRASHLNIMLLFPLSFISTKNSLPSEVINLWNQGNLNSTIFVDCRIHIRLRLPTLYTTSTPPEATNYDFPEDLATLFNTSCHVFEEPKYLPPPRVQDHSIPLIEGSNPIKVKPYRYPHSQKAEIENMVIEKLNQGIIEPSTGPFSSPILLVKKERRILDILYELSCFKSYHG